MTALQAAKRRKLILVPLPQNTNNTKTAVIKMKWLAEIRGKRTQQAMADQIGISQSGYASIESGARKPSVTMAKRIAKAMGFEWTRFFEEAGQDSV